MLKILFRIGIFLNMPNIVSAACDCKCTAESETAISDDAVNQSYTYGDSSNTYTASYDISAAVSNNECQLSDISSNPVMSITSVPESIDTSFISFVMGTDN
jgi:hypothetical protein